MQIHGPSETVDQIGVTLNPGVSQPFAVLNFGSAEIYVQSIADADQLVEAAILARSLLLGETSEPVVADPPAHDDEGITGLHWDNLGHGGAS